MADELIDLINDTNEVVGKEMKSVVHQNGLPHRVSALLLQNAGGKYLIPTASNIKVETGGLYHSAAGHVQAGESYLQCAVRELQEELSLKVTEDQLQYLGSYWFEKTYPTRNEKERFEIFKVIHLPQLGTIKMNDEQVNEQWLSEEELKHIYQEHPEKLSANLMQSCQVIFKF